jgi:hypothetical protein
VDNLRGTLLIDEFGHPLSALGHPTAFHVVEHVAEGFDRNGERGCGWPPLSETMLLPVINRIYESVERPELWPDTIYTT